MESVFRSCGWVVVGKFTAVAPKRAPTIGDQRAGEMKHTFKVFDSDMHVVEPPNLWQRYVDKEFASAVPHGLTRYPSDVALEHQGKYWGRPPDSKRLQGWEQSPEVVASREWCKPFETEAGRARRRSTRWTSKVSIWRCCIPRVVFCVLQSQILTRSLPRLLHACRTIGYTTSWNRTAHACSGRR